MSKETDPALKIEAPSMTPMEFGFTHQEQGPEYTPTPDSLPIVYRDKVDRPLHTQLLVTDQGNPVLITSSIKFHPRIADLADNIEPNKRHQYSDDVQGHFLKGVKDIIDENGAHTKRMSNCLEPFFYGGSVGVNNGRLLRVYFNPIGSYEGIPVIAKIGATRTKEDEAKLYRAFGNKGKGKI